MVKGTLSRFSWSMKGVATSCGGLIYGSIFELFIEGGDPIGGVCSKFGYGDYVYAPEIFNDQKSHIVSMKKRVYEGGVSGVFIFIYGN